MILKFGFVLQISAGALIFLSSLMSSASAQQKVLIDFGNNSTFRGASTPGNWNSVANGYLADLIDKNGQPTTLDYAPDGLGNIDSFNSIAGPTSNPPSASEITIADGALNKTALGDLGVAEAALDFFVSDHGTTQTGRFQIRGLAVGQKYRFAFYGTKQYVAAGNEQTRFTVHADNSYANPLGQGVLTTGTTNGDGNPNQVASFLVIPAASTVFIEWAGVNDSTKGYLNAMSIEEVPFVPAGGRAVLLDFGAASASSVFATQAGADTNGLYWNGVAYGYLSGLVDTSGNSTTFAFGPDGSTGAGSYNGPAGPTSNPLTSQEIINAFTAVNSALLGPLGGSGAAVVDWFANPKFQIQGLDANKKYQLIFFGSRKYPANDTITRYSLYTDSFYSEPALNYADLQVGVGGEHNRTQVAILDDVSPQQVGPGGIIYVAVAGASGAGSTGYLNAMMVVEKDTTAPVIALTNPNTLRVDLGSTFTDPGATVTDDVDASRTVFGTGTVSTSTLGTYTLTYQATDAAGNAATAVTRTVLVTRPVVQSVLIDFGNNSTFRGASTPGNWNSVADGYLADLIDKNGQPTTLDYAPDGLGGTDSFNSIAGPTSNPPSASEITIADGALNKTALGDLGVAEAAIDFFKSDNGTTGVGRFQLQQLRKGRNYLLTFYGTAQYMDAGNKQTRFQVFSNPDYSDALASVDLTTGTTNGTGNRTRVALVSGLTGPDNTNNILYVQWQGVNVSTEGYLNAMLVQELETPDTNAPTLTLRGNNPINLNQGDTFLDPGAAFTDNMDIDRVVLSSVAVDTAVPGTYTLTYDAQDGAGNPAPQLTRTVIVAASSDPLATWLAGSPTNSQTVGKYAIGGAASVSGASEVPVMTASNNVLSLTAIVRKASANPKLNVDAEWATNLSSTTWTNQSVTSTTSGLAQPTDPELERRKFSVPYDPSSESRKFLRLKATLSP